MPINQLKNLIKGVEDKVPYIPDFKEFSQLIKVIIVSFYFCCIYSFVNIQELSEYIVILNKNIKTIIPYIFIECFMLWLSANLINKLKVIFKIIFLIFETIFSIYIVESIEANNFGYFLNSPEKTFSTCMVGVGFLFLFLIYFDWSEKNNNPDYLKAKLLALQSKMQPHFLFNTINTIVYLIKKKPDIAKKMLIDLSEIFRANLEEESGHYNTIKNELELTEKYLNIEKMRLDERLKVSLMVEPAIENDLIPKHLLQPLVENCILHGIQNLEKGGEVLIEIAKDKKNIIIKIQNDYNRLNQRKHNGNQVTVNNLDKRLNMLYNGHYSYIRKEANMKYTTEITIPVKEKKYAN